MSAWGIGAATNRTPGRPAAADAPTVDTLVGWIPGDVIAAYMALVLALQDNDQTDVTKPTSKWWLVGAIAASAVFTLLGGFAKPPPLKAWQRRLELGVRAALSAIAFALWSLVLPGSWWQSIGTIADNAAVVAILAGIAAAAFGLLAQGIVARLPAAPNPPPRV